MFNIWVTNRCNLNCAYCYEKKKSDIEFNMDLNALYKFIEKYNVQEDVVINFHGGEPLLNFPAIKEISYVIKDKYPTAELSFTTNGTIINNDILDFMYEMQCEVSISIDGDKNTHDRYRINKVGEGSHRLVMNTISRMKSRGITNIRYRMTFNSHTVDRLFDNINWLFVNRINNIVASPDYFDADWDEKSLENYENTLYRLKNYYNNIESGQLYISLLDNNLVKYKGRCNVGSGSYNIAVDGSVYPCTYTVGNLKYKIGNIMEGIDKKRVRSLQEICYQEINECDRCDYKMHCNAYRCRFVNEIIVGDINKVAPIICNFDNINYKFFVHS